MRTDHPLSLSPTGLCRLGVAQTKAYAPPCCRAAFCPRPRFTNLLRYYSTAMEILSTMLRVTFFCRRS